MWLKLKWARFFTLAGWDWTLAPRPGFDFSVTLPCNHSECSGSHILLVRVKERNRKELVTMHGNRFSVDQTWASPHVALFGDGPDNTCWVMSHGAGGGQFSVSEWLPEAFQLWSRASHH